MSQATRNALILMSAGLFAGFLSALQNQFDLPAVAIWPVLTFTGVTGIHAVELRMDIGATEENHRIDSLHNLGRWPRIAIGDMELNIPRSNRLGKHTSLKGFEQRLLTTRWTVISQGTDQKARANHHVSLR